MNKRAGEAEDKVLELELAEEMAKIALAARSFANLPQVQTILAAMKEGDGGYRSFCEAIGRLWTLRSSFERTFFAGRSKQKAKRAAITDHVAVLARLCVFIRYGAPRAQGLCGRDSRKPGAHRTFDRLRMLLSDRRLE